MDVSASVDKIARLILVANDNGRTHIQLGSDTLIRIDSIETVVA